MHVSGHGPGCALSENAKLPNMQVEFLEITKYFVLFIIEYSQAISKKKASYDLVSQLKFPVFR